MEPLNDNTVEGKKEFNINLSSSLDFTIKEEKVLRSNTDKDKINGGNKFNEDSKIIGMFVPNAEEVTLSKDFLQSTTADKTFIATNIMGSKQKRIQYSQEIVNSVKSKLFENGACSSVVEGVTMKIENPEITHKLEVDYKFLKFGTKEPVLKGENAETIIHNTRGSKRKHIRVKSSKKFLKYVCKVCGISLQTASSLRNHVMTHTGEKPHSCPYCSMTFRQSHHLTEHIRTHTGERPFECELCEDTFTTQSALKSHTKVHNEVKNHKCQICYAAFSDDVQLRTHLQKHKDKFYECSECGDKFITAPRLKRHQMIHSGERPFQCEECGVSFREETTLRAHMGTHLPRGPYSCSMCGEVFLRLNSLSLHKKVHNTNGTYRYVPRKMGSVHNTENAIDIVLHEDICTKKCLAENSECRNKHELTKENNLKNKIAKSSSDAFSCNQNIQPQELDSCFTSNNQPSVDYASNVMTEVEQEMANIPHPDVVRDALATGTVLESQGEDGQGYLIVLPKALAEKDYTLITFPPMPMPKISTISESVVLQESEELGNDNCDLLVWDNDLDSVTEVAFESEKELPVLPVEEIDNVKNKKKQKVSIEKEVIIHELHTNKSITGKFQRKEKKMMDKKMRIPKSYECQHCGKNCKTSSNYIIHMRTHTGERPYYCDYCGIGFKQLAHLKAHVRIHTGEEPYKCSLCHAAFKQSSRLRSHQRTQHIEGKIKKKKIVKRCFVRNFYCKICDKTFLDSCYKKQHMKTHADETQNKCTKCDAIFKTKNSLRKHSKLHVDDNCGLQLKSVKDLNFHKQTSHRKDIIGLDKEGSFFLDEIKLEVKYDVACSDEVKENIMQPVFTSDNDQFKHKGSFEVDSEPAENVTKSSSSITNVFKQYQCTVCEKVFKQNSNLKTHMRMHTDERPYKCNDCGSAFRQISHLKDHVKMHTGEKPFKCSGCSAAFTQSSAVKYHIKKYHQGKAHVMKEQKNTHLSDKELIFLEKTGNLYDDTVVISIENSVSVSIEHKTSEKDAEIMIDEKKEHCNKCGKYSPICSLKIHKCIPNKNKFGKCEMCKISFRKNSNHLRPANTEEQQHVCRRCATQEISPNILIPSVSCKEEACEENTGNHIDKTDHTEKHRTLFKGFCTKIDIKRCNEKSFEIFKEISEFSDCVESCSKLGESRKDLRTNMISGNICNICGKIFRRASALKFHKRMSHRNSFDEESLPLNCKSDNVDLTKDVKAKCLGKLIRETPVKKQEIKNFPFLINETEDRATYMIEYCKCSFCGEKLSNLSKLNEHVNKLHPEEILNEKLQADESIISSMPTSNTGLTHKKNKRARKIKDNCKSSDVTNVGDREIYLNENSRYKCQGCEKSFTRVAKLKDHISNWCKVKKNFRELYT